ncbi:SDR family NAD(P)-dependent oxidoreductase [Sorangium sp. So ce1099]|uniref:SDR family NAD(P)-dependent oxidoreductase n=1 Tax=Sorangium sp. So ce1099 TaxID=3133331 RepID=UPI003F5D699B
MTSLDDIRAWLIAHLTARVGVDPQAAHPTERFQRLGLDSSTATAMLAELGAALGRPLSPTLAWEYPTPEALARHLAGGDAAAQAPDIVLQAGRTDDEPIAIVGIACRFPGAPSPEAFWALLRDGVDAITEVPADRWDIDALYAPDVAAPGKMSTRWGGFLSDVDRFEPGAFGISPREAAQMDPQQRLALELSWEALEDTGVVPASLRDTRTSVFFGAMWMDYSRVPGAVPAQIAQHTATGQDLSIVPARVSYTLGLLGPSVAVNTACSSSLVAVHLACQSLLRGESRVALAGGVNLLIAPESTIAMTKFGAMAPDGRSKAFDSRANGYVRGEGGGVVVLKRLSDALADGDTIYCVIRGSAVNNDGFSNGLTAPSPRAQQGVLRDACAAAGVAPADVQYVEAHGTGTMLGDPIEAGALGAALGAGAGRSPERALRIGSVKTNIGHLEAAAGIAGLIKVALSMRHRTLPPSLHFKQPNPHIAFEALRLRVQTTLEPWEGEQERLLAGVSSFGFGGTNSHVIVEASALESPRLFVLSAEGEEGLRAQARRLVEELRAPSLEGRRAPSLEALCAASARRAHGPWRLSVVVRSRAELSRRLAAFSEGEASVGVHAGQARERRPRIAMLFTGQGSQYVGMGRRLYEAQPAFRAALDRCFELLEGELPRSLREVLWAAPGSADAALLNRTLYAQPALFAVGYALSELWRAFGIEPDVVLGHSLGELCAAAVAGVLSLPDAVRLVAARGRLMDALPEGGAMIAVAADEERVAPRVAPVSCRAAIGAVNAPGHVVLSGAEDAVAAIAASFAAEGVETRRLAISHACHSPLMAPMRDDFRQVAETITYRPPRTALISNIEGRRAADAIAGPEHWVRHLEAPVRFADGLAALAAEQVDVALEVGAHPVLLGLAALSPRFAAARIPSLERGADDATAVLEALGRLFVAGARVELEGGPGAGLATLAVLSARSEGALRAQAERLWTHLEAHPEQGLGDVAYSLATSRSGMEHRVAVAASSREGLRSALEAVGRGERPSGVASGAVAASRGKLAFLFTGQGAQVPGMGRGLYRAWPAFREAMDRCVALFERELGRRLVEVMWSEPGSAEASLLEQTCFTQPALFSLEYALAALWRSWGVEAELVAGHSVGELVAACVAGVFSVQDAARLVAARGRLMQALPAGGAMVAVAAEEGEVARAVAPCGARVSIAAVNGPAQVVISGDEEPVRELAAWFAGRGVRTSALRVSHAFHSERMAPMLEEFGRVAETVSYSAPSVPVASNVSGVLSGSELATAGYWVEQARRAVRFGDGVRALHAAGASSFVEVGPRATLLGVVPSCLPGVEPLLVASLRSGREETACALEALGGVWTAGHGVDWAGVFPAGGRRVPLPTYSWQRERYWVEAPDAAMVPAGEATGRPQEPPRAFYRLDWREAPPPGASEMQTLGRWVVVAARGSAAAEALSARLGGCVSTEPDGLEAALCGIDAPAGVICLWEAGAGEEAPQAALRVAADSLSVVHALRERAPSRLWWVTTGAVPVHAAERVDVSTAPLWGLGRAAMQEHPELGCTLVDLAPGEDAVDALMHELRARDDESQVAWRAGRRYVARLVRAEAIATASPAPASTPASMRACPQGAVLVTGGLGALGLHVARWLAGQGVPHLVLTGRRGLETPGAADAVAELTALGARVTVAAVDVADRQALGAVLAAIPVETPLRGVVHAAGVIDAGMLADQTADRLARVFGPKVGGAWNLHELTAGHALDFFVLFSSVAGLWAAAGQGNYAAANCFLDALAARRKAQGLPAQSLAWGPWSEAGMAVELGAAQQARLARLGTLELSPAQGVRLLEQALTRPEAHLVAARLDLEAARQAFGVSVPSMWRALVRASAAAPSTGAQSAWTARLAPLPPARRTEEVRAAVREELARVLSLSSPGAVPVDRPMRELGLDSLMAVELRRSLGERVGASLPATLAFDHPTVDALTRWLLDEVLVVAEPAAAPARAPSKAALDEPIAIVGVGCRYPGGVVDPEGLWRVLEEGLDVIHEMPRDRWDVDALYDPDPDAPGKMTTRRGGFLADIDRFDPAFFGISPREAAKMDPQQRLLLETSWEALERAGISTERLMGSDTGVFVGLIYQEYASLGGGIEALDGYVGTGSWASVASGRISYALGLKGPSMTVDTACSSSLVTIHLACQALRQGECSMALAGGVTLMLTPSTFVEFSRLRGLSPDGRSKSFSAAADGVGWSEGCGVLVLKRLSDARRDGDAILALIRGSAVNQDGRSNGLTAPNGPSQQAVIRQALEQAGIAPADVSYVECHGTGTSLGDPIEVQALGAALGAGRAPTRPVVIGSIKSNIGHTQAAAGVAGVIKVALAMQHGSIPRNLHFEAPSPHIPWESLPVKVAAEPVAWPRGGAPRRAGVSSFGISGTNVHVVLEEAPAVEPRRAAPALPAYPVVLSARSEGALRAQAERLWTHLEAHPEQGLGDVAYSLATSRSGMEHRVAVAASSREGLRSALEAVGRGERPSGVASGAVAASRGKLAFLFTGQGAQVPGMGRGLYRAWPAFREAMDRCVALFERELGRRLVEVMWSEPGSAEASLLEQTCFTQPALFSLEYALAALWRSWGVEAELVAGHSVGELVAACVAGVFSVQDAARLVAARGRLMQALPAGGAMVAVAAEEGEVARAVAPCGARVSIAAVNGPAQVVISGDEEPVRELAAWFAGRGVRTSALRVSHAFHSERMAPMLEEFGRVAETVSYSAPSVPVASNVSGVLSGSELATAGYWVEQARRAVRFGDGVRALHAAGASSFVEVGPRATLLGVVPSCLPGVEPLLVASLRSGREETACALEALGGVWTAGHGVDWAGVFPAGGRRVPLPTYSWQRERYWVDAAPSAPRGLAAARSTPPTPGEEPSVAELRAAVPAEAELAPPPRPRERASGAWAARLGSLAAAARAAEVDAAVRSDVAKVLTFRSKDDLPHDRPLTELGLDSVMAMELRSAIAERLGRPLPTTLVFDYPTVGALARYLLDQVRSDEPSGTAVRLSSTRVVGDEPIAIVGIGCRFPGEVRDLESFWRLLEDGVDAIREVPKERWDIDAHYDPAPDASGKMMTRSGGFLDHVDRFDPSFFGISPREAAKMDPQQRLLLEVSWEALEHAGMPPDRLLESETGVFVGLATNDYAQLTSSALEQLDGHVFTGNAASVASGRISYLLGLRGPSVTVDTACSSSLVAMHLACQSLRVGECSAALAGGVTLNLTPAGFVEFSRLRALSPDGRCKSFDASADGAAWSDGCGVVVLKRLSDAQRDGDPILAVIRGSAINQDGRSNGLTAPSGLAQEAVIRRALEKAGVAPGAVGYVEAHGTGTPLGDPIEMLALGKVLAEGRAEGSPVIVGSLKSNIGHAVAAAGVGGVIKTVLALQHETIPRSLHFRVPSPHIPWADLPVKVAAEAVPWPAGGVARIAGVSSFGASGTNAHMVLEEAPRATRVDARGDTPVVLLPLSAKTPEALSALARAYRGFLARFPAEPPSSLEDIAYTASVRRGHHERRLALVGRSREELIEAIDSLLQEQESAAARARPSSSVRPRLTFVFAGQGAQWVGMGLELLQKEPVFRAAIDACDALVKRHAGWSLRDALEAPESTSRLDETEVGQPVLFAIQVALAALWASWGILPDAVIGHSVGEVAAAHVSGALGLEDAVRLIVARGRVAQRATGLGKMAPVALSQEKAILALQGYEDRIAIAAVNDPGSVVLSGQADALAEVIERLQLQGVDCRMLRVDYASHSPQMAPFQRALASELDRLSPGQAKLTMYSTVTGARVEGGELGADYWGTNLREPVQFAAAVEAAIGDGHRLFLEVGPHPVLSASIEQCLAAAKAAGHAVATLRRGKEERRCLLQALGALYTQGVSVAFEALYRGGGRCVSLPLYPWQRQRYWVDPAPEKAGPSRAAASRHPHLGAHQVSARTGEHIWEVVLDPEVLPLLREHRAHGLPLVPISLIADLVLSAAGDLWSSGTALVQKCTLEAPWILPDEGRRSGQLVLVSQPDDRLLFELFSAPDGDGAWQRHASGEVVRAPATQGAFEVRQSLTEIRARCREETTGQDHEAQLRGRGLSLGGPFRCLANVWRRDGEALARIRLPEPGASPVAGFRIHPALLEAGLRALVSAMRATDAAALLLPDRIEHLGLHGRVSAAAWCHALLRDRGGDGTWTGDVRLLDEDGRVLVEISGLRVRPAAPEIARQAAGKRLNDWLYELVWQPKPLEVARTRAEDVGRWLILADRGGVGEALAGALRDRGREVLLAFAGQERGASGPGRLTLDPSRREDFDWLLEEARARLGSVRGVVHLMSLDAVVTDEAAPASLKAAQEIGCNSVPPMVQALVSTEHPSPPSLWFITRGAQPASDGPAPLAIAQTPMWGMGRVLALEHPELWGGMVDLDPVATGADVARLAEELLGSDGEDHVAFRGEERRVARVRRGRVEELPSAPVALRSDASYLITGGLGGLGIQVARRLVDAGARHLVLTGRRGLPDRSTWDALPADDASWTAIAAIQDMERRGASVTCAAADVGDPAQMAGLVAQIKPALRGVIHAAGVSVRKPIAQMTREDAIAALAPKVEGSWILHRQTRDLPLDFFVMFSSAAAMWGAATQGAYAAANHFMDGLAHHRRALGAPGTSINWGSWEGGGMITGAPDEVLRFFEQIGFGIMPAEQAIETFGRFLGGGAPVQRAVASVDWSRYKPIFESRRKMPLFERIDVGDTGRESEAASGPPALLRQLASASREERIEILRAHVRRRVMEVLELPADAHGPPPDQGFFQLGMDSLMSVQLKRRLDADLGRTLPTTLVFEHASIGALSRHLASVLDAEQAGTAVSEERSPPSRRASVRPPAPRAPLSRRSSATEHGAARRRMVQPALPDAEPTSASEDELLDLLAKELAALSVRSARGARK